MIRTLRPLVCGLVLALSGAGLAAAQMPGTATDKECLECHPHFKDERKGKFNHPPFWAEDCWDCHVFHGFAQRMELDGTVLEVCTQCHDTVEDLDEEDIHYPLTEDDSCVTCHDAHSGDNELFLYLEAPAICLECHEDEPGQKDVVHVPFADQDCSWCHDPHGSVFPANLVQRPDLLCTGCHDDFTVDEETEPVDVHGGEGEGLCTNCHNGHYSRAGSMLKAGEPDLCFKCHEEIEELVNLEYAHAVGEECLSCHTPHAHRADLQSVELCAECHDYEDEAWLDNHDLGDFDACTECHNPHGAADEYMLE